MLTRIDPSPQNGSEDEVVEAKKDHTLLDLTGLVVDTNTEGPNVCKILAQELFILGQDFLRSRPSLAIDGVGCEPND